MTTIHFNGEVTLTGFVGKPAKAAHFYTLKTTELNKAAQKQLQKYLGPDIPISSNLIDSVTIKNDRDLVIRTLVDQTDTTLHSLIVHSVLKHFKKMANTKVEKRRHLSASNPNLAKQMNYFNHMAKKIELLKPFTDHRKEKLPKKLINKLKALSKWNNTPKPYPSVLDFSDEHYEFQLNLKDFELLSFYGDRFENDTVKKSYNKGLNWVLVARELLHKVRTQFD